jgi:hypothetical protein
MLLFCRLLEGSGLNSNGGRLNERKPKSKTLACAGRLQTSIVPVSNSLLPDTCLTCQPNFVALAPSNSKPIQST